MNVFDEVNKVAASVVEGFNVEPGMEVNHEHRVVVAGVLVSSMGFDAPVFISVDELRRMADEAEKIAAESMRKRSEG
ncbi:hypothetical protein JD523_20175 [Aeromonas enteropelogenes]|uniref:hypothetical protein n=1 Tax=Aeromonas enteropelogenes TaxID=29489 RepID=UPI00191E504B|nr:hypothetical protein [Aeromonas enteropelogenes]MBL0523177.1 hypothetical protein [Aeromonas enteropelogenes]